MAACKNGHVEVVDKLLQHGARPDLQDKVYTSCKPSTCFLTHILSKYSHPVPENEESHMC